MDEVFSGAITRHRSDYSHTKIISKRFLNELIVARTYILLFTIGQEVLLLLWW